MPFILAQMGSNMTKDYVNLKVYRTSRQRLKVLAAQANMQMIDYLEQLLSQQENKKMDTTVTLQFVAQSGHAWEETVDTDDIDSTIEQTVATHGDIERVDVLDKNGRNPETIWKFE